MIAVGGNSMLWLHPTDLKEEPDPEHKDLLSPVRAAQALPGLLPLLAPPTSSHCDDVRDVFKLEVFSEIRLKSNKGFIKTKVHFCWKIQFRAEGPESDEVEKTRRMRRVRVRPAEWHTDRRTDRQTGTQTLRRIRQT